MMSVSPPPYPLHNQHAHPYSSVPLSPPPSVSPSPSPTRPTHAHRVSLPIAIPRRQAARPPPCSPTRPLPAPDLVFNLDFSVSPCSFQGQSLIHGRSLGGRKGLRDEWESTLVHQRGRANGVLAHQCHRAQMQMHASKRMRSPSVRSGFEYEYVYDEDPVLLGVGLDSQDSVCEPGIPQSSLGAAAEELSAMHAGSDVDSRVAQALAFSAVSPACSSVVFATPPCDMPASPAASSSGTGSSIEGLGIGLHCNDSNLRLTSAFRRALTSSTRSPTADYDTESSSYFPPLSPPSIGFAAHRYSHTHASQQPPSPISLTRRSASPPPVSPPYAHPRPRRILSTIFPAAQRTAAAAPVVSFNVAQAERPAAYGQWWSTPATPTTSRRWSRSRSRSRSSLRLPALSALPAPSTGANATSVAVGAHGRYRNRARSPYPGLGNRAGFRARRGSSACSPRAKDMTVLGAGREAWPTPLMLSNEDIERSLEKEDSLARMERERDEECERDGEPERDWDEKSAVWDLRGRDAELEREWEWERGRTRGRGYPRGRGVAVMRPLPAHM